MGDRCYFSMTILEQDKAAVDRIMFGDSSLQPWPEEEDNGDGTITLAEHEANYAYRDQRQELAEAGIAFEGYHGPGGEYSEGVFACFNREQVEVAAIEATPVAFVNTNGRIDKWSLKAARDYCRVLDRVKRCFKTKVRHAEGDTQEAGHDKRGAGGGA